MNIQNAKVQKVQEVRAIDLMIELDSINDKIPINTGYVLGGVSVICLNTAINDIIINFTKGYKSVSSILTIKNTYEEVTSNKVSVIELMNNPIGDLFKLLDELIDKIPLGIPVVFLRDQVSCFNKTISLVKEGLQNHPYDTYWKSCIREIYKIMESNNHIQFNGKY